MNKLPSLPARAGDLNDLHTYDPISQAWIDLSAAVSGVPPSSRDSHGFKAAGGILYVHGGENSDGEKMGDGMIGTILIVNLIMF